MMRGLSRQLRRLRRRADAQAGRLPPALTADTVRALLAGEEPPPGAELFPGLLEAAQHQADLVRAMLSTIPGPPEDESPEVRPWPP
jgi:hypothetical protein